MHTLWSGMAPQDMFDALADAPRVAGPWQPAFVDGGGVERWPPCRKSHEGVTLVWEREGLVSVHACAIRGFASTPIDCKTRDEADEVLRKEGWVLV